MRLIFMVDFRNQYVDISWQNSIINIHNVTNKITSKLANVIDNFRNEYFLLEFQFPRK